jgi:hypothetical protein
MSKVGFWLKGSTGKLAGTTLYKGANGETIQREIVSPSNPKTMAQNIQRVVMSTIGAAYSVMKAICDHSFEGVKKGQETMSLFMSENIQKSRAAIEEMQAQGVSFVNMYSFVPVGMKHSFAPNQYLVAMGSLPQVKTNWIEDGTSHIVYPTVVAITTNTYEEVINKLGLKRGDQLTFCTVKQGATIQESQFNFARVILDPTDENFMPLPLSTAFLDANGLINKPSVRNEGKFKFLINASGLRYWYEDLYTTEEDAVAAFVIVSRKEGDTWKRSTTYVAYPGETAGAYSMQQCLDLISNGAQHTIYAGSDQYLNNAGEGGGQAAADGEQTGGGSTGGDTPSQLFSISSATVNNESITVGTAKQVMCAEGETTEDLDIRIVFSNVGSAQAIQLFKNGTQVGNDHAIDGNAANFVVSAAEIGSYVIKVKKSDNSVSTPGYSINVVEYSEGGGGYNPGGGMDQN